MGFEFTTPATTKWHLEEFMGLIDAFEEALADKVHHKFCTGQSYQMILLHILGKVLVTTREVLNLCALGYPEGALSLTRNVYEQSVIVFFFEEHRNDVDFQEYVDDFFLSYESQRNKCLQTCERLFPTGQKDQLDKEKENIKGREKRNIMTDYGWSGYDSFAKLAEGVIKHQQDESLRHFLGKQYLLYKRACLSLHAGCMGNMIRLGRNTSYEVIDTSPSVYGQSLPLGYMASSLIPIVGILCKEFDVDGEKYLKQLNRLVQYYQSQEKDDVEPL